MPREPPDLEGMNVEDTKQEPQRDEIDEQVPEHTQIEESVPLAFMLVVARSKAKCLCLKL